MKDIIKNKDIYFFSPHPDDIAIACGGLAKSYHDNSKILILLTSGYEAYLPDEVFKYYNEEIPRAEDEKNSLKSKIRIRESIEEAGVLGIDQSNVKLFKNQMWHNNHLTKRVDCYSDGSIKNIAKYVPNIIDRKSIKEITDFLPKDVDNSLFFIPYIDDMLLMHIISSLLVLIAIKLKYRGSAVVFMYECLTSNLNTLNSLYLKNFKHFFNSKTMKAKLNAINKHISMKIRIKMTGSYSTATHSFYDVIIERKNRQPCFSLLGSEPIYCENYYLATDINLLLEFMLNQLDTIPAHIVMSASHILQEKTI